MHFLEIKDMRLPISSQSNGRIVRIKRLFLYPSLERRELQACEYVPSNGFCAILIGGRTFVYLIHFYYCVTLPSRRGLSLSPS